jgi:hypothetical protein
LPASAAHTSGALVGLEPQSDGSVFITYSLVAGVSTQDRQTIELGLALLCAELRTHCGPQWMPRGVMFCHDRPADLDSHQHCFGPEVRFNRESNALWLDAASLSKPLAVVADPAHAELMPPLVNRVDEAVLRLPSPLLAGGGLNLWSLAAGIFGRRAGTRLALQWPAEVEIALREWNLDTLVVKRGIDGAVQVAGYIPAPLDIADDDTQFKIE